MTCHLTVQWNEPEEGCCILGPYEEDEANEVATFINDHELAPEWGLFATVHHGNLIKPKDIQAIKDMFGLNEEKV